MTDRLRERASKTLRAFCTTGSRAADVWSMWRENFLHCPVYCSRYGQNLRAEGILRDRIELQWLLLCQWSRKGQVLGEIRFLTGTLFLHFCILGAYNSSWHMVGAQICGELINGKWNFWEPTSPPIVLLLAHYTQTLPSTDENTEPRLVTGFARIDSKGQNWDSNPGPPDPESFSLP